MANLFSAVCGEMTINWSIGSSTQISTPISHSISSQWGWWSTGTGCPGRLWSVLLWRYSRLVSMLSRDPFQPLQFCDSVINFRYCITLFIFLFRISLFKIIYIYIYVVYQATYWIQNDKWFRSEEKWWQALITRREQEKLKYFTVLRSLQGIWVNFQNQ